MEDLIDLLSSLIESLRDGLTEDDFNYYTIRLGQIKEML